MNRTAVVTGAGSGVGLATAHALVEAGWNVALVGRRAALLNDAIASLPKTTGKTIACAADISDPAEVEKMARHVESALGPVQLLVNAAGTNAPKRSLAELSLADYQQMIATNLTGSYLCLQAFLPGMRQRKSGTIVNIVSDAAKQASAKAGPAYVASKAGQAGLTQAINAEERVHGIRACAIFPGDINTPLLDKRPAPPSAEARQKMLTPDDVAACVMLVVNLPARAVVEEILIRPA